MASIAAYRSRLAPTLFPFVAFAWRLVLVLTLSRIALVAWQWDRVLAADMLGPIFVQGLRFDLVLLGLLSIVPLLCWPAFASSHTLLPVWRLVTKFYFPLALLLVLFMELSTPSFVQQFDFRPNILFVEYLDRPKEVFATLWGAYRLPLLAGVLASFGFAWLSVRQFGRMAEKAAATGAGPALLTLPILLILCLAAVRSTTDHRPVNPSTVALSTDPLANDLALNSTYTVLYAIYETGEDARGGIRYGNMPAADVVPVKRFHIPALILGGSIEPLVYANVASQIDLPPTLLSLINVGAEHPMIGHDLTRPDAATATGRAIMQFNSKQAYMQGDQVIVLQKGLPARQYRYVNESLLPLADVDAALSNRALAHSIWSSAAYEDSLYRLPATDQVSPVGR